MKIYKKKNKYTISIISILIFCVILYFALPFFLRIIDKSIVKNYDFKNEDFVDVHNASHDEMSTCIVLQNGKNVKCKNFNFYSRGISHHNWDPFYRFKGYYYVNVDGELFYRKIGPCTTSDSLSFQGLKLDMITKDIFINVLLKHWYKKEK